ncbi:uncharacterized protein LOC132725500 [Ruditapes philippinarum]|uniref:uncharacterized protein LOC132725500 n=1 Tax=Ruditapes philippinarum TaxID=129788 RepID=UPI00295AADA3|nr:uncharacterized protein LOC132725500 [Ruditapes philippinarum]
MASYSPKLSDKKYNNWVKAQLAALFTKEGLEPFVCHEVQEFQLKCLDDICYNNGLISGTLCSNCCTENVIKCPTNRICNVGRGKCSYHRNAATRYNPAGCPNKICHNFTTEIQNAHRYAGPSYKNTDATQWCSNFWEVAKCFMPPDGFKDKASATETDFNGIISVILNYKDFQMKIHENLNNKTNMFEEAREIERNVRHSPTLEVEDSDLQKYYILLILQKLLSDPVYLGSDTLAQNAKKKLIELENDTLTLGKNDLKQVLDDVAKAIQDKMKAGLDEQYDRIKLDMIKRKQEDLQSLHSQIDEELTQLKDKSDASVKRLNEERDKAATGHSSLIPLEILRMDKHSIELYKRALSEGKEAVYNIRVMVVGHYGVGKTTLTKRLLDEDVDINKRESTNGIDVHVKRCKVSRETGQWETVAKDQKVGTVCNRLLHLLKKPLTTEKEVVVMENESTVGAVNEEFEVVDEDTAIESNSQDITEKNEGAEVVCTEPEPKKLKVTLTPLEEENVTYENFQPLQDTKEENILYHLKALIEEVQHSGSTDDLNMADVSIWDFAGQSVFYATHQVFLSRRAVYLLVTDVSKRMEDEVKDDECFQDSKGVKHWKISGMP